MEAFPSAIAQENERNLPFLATTTILMEAVKRGAGRETAHEAIKEHSLAAVKAMRTGAAGGADLLERLAGDRRIGLGKKALQAILAESARFVGSAPSQVDAFRGRGQAAGKAGEGRRRLPADAHLVGRFRVARSFQLRLPRRCAFLDLHCPDKSLLSNLMAELVGNVLVGQSGGPTSVINASVAGIVAEALNHVAIEEIYGGLNGVLGILQEDLVDLASESQQQIRALRHTPGRPWAPAATS